MEDMRKRASRLYRSLMRRAALAKPSRTEFTPFEKGQPRDLTPATAFSPRASLPLDSSADRLKKPLGDRVD